MHLTNWSDTTACLHSSCMQQFLTKQYAVAYSMQRKTCHWVINDGPEPQAAIAHKLVQVLGEATLRTEPAKHQAQHQQPVSIVH